MKVVWLGVEVVSRVNVETIEDFGGATYMIIVTADWFHFALRFCDT